MKAPSGGVRVFQGGTSPYLVLLPGDGGGSIHLFQADAVLPPLVRPAVPRAVEGGGSRYGKSAVEVVIVLRENDNDGDNNIYIQRIYYLRDHGARRSIVALWYKASRRSKAASLCQIRFRWIVGAASCPTHGVEGKISHGVAWRIFQKASAFYLPLPAYRYTAGRARATSPYLMKNNLSWYSLLRMLNPRRTIIVYSSVLFIFPSMVLKMSQPHLQNWIFYLILWYSREVCKKTCTTKSFFYRRCTGVDLIFWWSVFLFVHEHLFVHLFVTYMTVHRYRKACARVHLFYLICCRPGLRLRVILPVLKAFGGMTDLYLPHSEKANQNRRGLL